MALANTPRIIGGPSVVQDYVRSLGIAEFQLQDGEHGLQSDPTAQYGNWIEPAAAVQLPEHLVSNSPLPPAANDFLVQTLTASQTGPKRLRGGLPPSTVLAHKTGTSGEHNGKAEATNDIGLTTLPDGRRLAVAVFVTDGRANEATRDGVIARIGRAAYDEALHTYGPTQAHNSAKRPVGSKAPVTSIRQVLSKHPLSCRDSNCACVAATSYLARFFAAESESITPWVTPIPNWPTASFLRRLTLFLRTE